MGKSTLFNKLIGQRLSIVEDTPGVTRDRIYAKCEWLNHEFMLVDTGGIEPDSDDVILSQMRRQAELAITKADVTVLVTDMTCGVTANDYEVAAMLQKSGKPIILCVNKCDGVGEPPVEFYEFYNLGLGDPVQVSAVHGHGTGDLLDAVYEHLTFSDEEEEGEDAVNVAVIGKPNAGKSSLINMLCRNKKLAMTSSKPGKTRLVNHFLINREWYLVDLPGYGYAKMSATAKQKLEQVIRNYINLSEEMVMLFVLIDSRHDIGQVDMDFLIELGQSQIPFAIIFTKGDKNGPVALAKQVDKMKAQILELWEELPPTFISSSETGLGRDEILGYIESVLEQMKDNQ